MTGDHDGELRPILLKDGFLIAHVVTVSLKDFEQGLSIFNVLA
ncbi:hypothetical protein QWJ07_27145 [Frankia sp. RB7]|nr:hypothetical protein [Frankia sp. RB7]